GQREFDVVICHSAWSQAIFGSTVQRLLTPRVFYLHGGSEGRHWLERWAKLTTPDFAICNSRFSSESLARLYPCVSSQVLHCAVASPEDVMSRVDRARTRCEHTTAEADVVVVQVSRLEHGKGQM